MRGFYDVNMPGVGMPVLEAPLLLREGLKKRKVINILWIEEGSSHVNKQWGGGSLHVDKNFP